MLCLGIQLRVTDHGTFSSLEPNEVFLKIFQSEDPRLKKKIKDSSLESTD